ncbi:MAG: HEAT repeat domain-containing protein [Enterobacterales bacterium]|nr:HEAT repeat domain-containing protein [Enterobacterales bacterium]
MNSDTPSGNQSETTSDKADKATAEMIDSVDEALSKGAKPYISSQRLEANRWQVRQKLLSLQAKRNAPLTRLPQYLFAHRGAIVAMSLTFVLGYSMALFNPSSLGDSNYQELAAQESSASMLNNGHFENKDLISDTQIIDLKMSPFIAGQKVKLSYTSVTQSQLYASLTDDKTLALLSQAMRNDLADETRLQLVEVLQHHLDRRSVIDSLSYSLLNDPNPGVRMLVANSLARLSNQPEVRQTLRYALAKDINSGVRISAFNGLIQHLEDDETITLLKNKILKDSNLYIRKKTRELVKSQTNQPDKNQI